MPFILHLFSARLLLNLHSKDYFQAVEGRKFDLDYILISEQKGKYTVHTG